MGLFVTEHSLTVLTNTQAHLMVPGKRLPVLGVASAQEACREEVGEQRDSGRLNSHVKEPGL